MRVAGGTDGDAGRNAFRALSPREIEIVRWIADGLSNRDVAAKLSISQKTVISHLHHVFEKLGVRNRLHAALLYTKLANREIE